MKKKERCLIYDCEVTVVDGECTEDCICDNRALVDQERIRRVEKKSEKKQDVKD